MWVRLLLTVVIGYFLGNLNGAFIMYNLLTHEDIRKSGSGNAGLTNFMRQFGPGKGIWVLLIDIGKAVAACLIGKALFAPLGMPMEGLMFGALAVSLGHDFPALLGFHGGKGIVCGFSVALCADWRCALIILAVFAICLYFTRYVSLSSILGAAAFCVGFAMLHWQEPVVAVIGVLIGLLAIFMHRSNIKRLLAGTEKKATFSKFKKKK
jgi:glycerol-3-phosphate acyltransferase PlsY